MRYGMHSILCPHPNSLRTKTSVEGVSVLQSQTTIHVAMIPNHEAVISFWGKQGVNVYATVTHNLFVKNFNFCRYINVTIVTYERGLK